MADHNESESPLAREAYRSPSMATVGPVANLTQGPVTVPTSETYGYKSASAVDIVPGDDAV